MSTAKASSRFAGEEAFVVLRCEPEIDFRPAAVPGKVTDMLIRRETPADRAAIHTVHSEAFRREPDVTPIEAPLVDDLRAEGDLLDALSLVAVHDGELVGHVCCSRARIGDDTTAAVGLGPLGVLPGFQHSGVGSALMHTVLGAADALGYGLVVLLGSPAYYSRFGFVLTSALGITPPEPQWAEHFQARTLGKYEATQTGAFSYAAAFSRI